MNIPGTRTLSQKSLLNILSKDIAGLSSVVFGAIFGGKMDISATGPISPFDGKVMGFIPASAFRPTMIGFTVPSFFGSGPVLASIWLRSWPVPFWPSLGGEGFEDFEEPSFFADIRARSRVEYSAGVCRELTATRSNNSVRSLMRLRVFCSFSKNG